METKRFTTWDVAKGFGMLLVILGHVIPENSYIRNFVYSFHMPLFFILSGFVLKHDGNKRSFVELIRAEKKLIATYLFWSIIYLAVDIFIKYGLLDALTLRRILEDLIYIFSTYGINVLWFIGSLVIGKVLTKNLLSLTNSERIEWISTALLIFLPALLSSKLSLVNRWFVSVILVVLLRGLFATGLILFGYLIKDKVVLVLLSRSGKRSSYGILLLFVNAFIANYIVEVDLHNMELGLWPLFILSMLTGTFGFICLCSLLEKVEFIQKALAFFGVNSLFIMVTHNYLCINDCVKYIVDIVIDNDNLTVVVLFVALVIIEIILCYFVSPVYNRLISRIVSLRN